MKITVLHNVNRDASFGLNMMFDLAGTFPEPRSHELVRVFEFDVDEIEDPDVKHYAMILADVCYRMFNVGHIDGMEGDFQYETAVAYRARRLRSLCKGDVLIIDSRFYACGRVDWDEVQAADVRVLSARGAAAAVRARYHFGEDELLSQSVPLAD